MILSQSRVNPLKTLVNLLNSFNKLYEEHSNSKCKNYISYTASGFVDEETLIEPTIFPLFLKEILNFTTLDYIPEMRNESHKAPVFTPIDTFAHPFIFETKGSDSRLQDLAKEFLPKSQFYLSMDAHLEFAIICNMKDVSVFSKSTGMNVEEFSFSIKRLYEIWQRGNIVPITKSQDLNHFLAFIQKFRRAKLNPDQKLRRIIDAPPHEKDYSKSQRAQLRTDGFPFSSSGGRIPF